VLLLLRKRPGITAKALSEALELTPVAVRRHLDALVAEGLAQSTGKASNGSVGRPSSGWALSSTGLELFPRRYDSLAVELLDDVSEELGADAVNAVLQRRTDKLVEQYSAEMEGITDLAGRVAELARIRDEAGYLADSQRRDDGSLVLTESNCAVHRVAQRHSCVCAMELHLMQRLLGPDVEVTRDAHTMSGDAVCSYVIRPAESGSSPDRHGSGPPPS
jgi:predicted ArsR family transcriptional regulator